MAVFKTEFGIFQLQAPGNPGFKGGKISGNWNCWIKWHSSGSSSVTPYVALVKLNEIVKTLTQDVSAPCSQCSPLTDHIYEVEYWLVKLFNNNPWMNFLPRKERVVMNRPKTWCQVLKLFSFLVLSLKLPAWHSITYKGEAGTTL